MFVILLVIQLPIFTKMTNEYYSCGRNRRITGNINYRIASKSERSCANSGLNPDITERIKIQCGKIVEKFKILGYLPVIITSATIRPYFFRLINSSFPEVSVLSYSELPSKIEIEFIDKVEVEYAN